MPFRISIPLPGPISWSPGRRRRRAARRSEPLVTRQDLDNATAALGRTADRIDASRTRLDDRAARQAETHQRQRAEQRDRLDQLRELPPWERFKASFRR